MTDNNSTPIGDTHLTATFNCEHCGMETNQRFTVPCTECGFDMKVCADCVNKNPFHDECPSSEDVDDDPTEMDEELQEEEEEDDSEPVSVETTHTQLADGTQNAATTKEAAASAAETNVPDSNTDTKKKRGDGESAYRKRLNEKGLDAFPLEAPKELVDMLRVACEKRGGLALAALTRELIVDYVNSLDLTHIDTTLDASSPNYNTPIPWKFDKSRLNETRTRTSTRGMTEEQKTARKEVQKQSAKQERELVKQLLAAHRAKLKGGDPNAAALEAALSASTGK